MIYEWTDLDIYEITAWFLYGKNYVPANNTADEMIREKDVKGQELWNGATIFVNMESYMTTGPGRFALGSESQLVSEFFALGADRDWMQVGREYTKEEIVSELNSRGSNLELFPDRITITQVNLKDDQESLADYWARSYIWNTGLFKLADTATFSRNSEGVLSINNYSIRAFHENFDYEGGGIRAAVANPLLEPRIDPWNIGRRVSMNFQGDGSPAKVYTYGDYLADVASHVYHLASGVNALPTLAAGLSEIINGLWESGITQNTYRGEQPLIYGTVEDDMLTAEKINEIPTFISPLHDYVSSRPNLGVAIVSGKGNDTLTGGKNDDVLYGGQGNDAFFGGKGGDKINGGKDSDHAYGEDGDDTIYGEDGIDVLFGDKDDDQLFGGEDDDFLDGGEGSDVLHGGAGKDELLGGEGTDLLLGGAGDDTLDGGEGNDILKGGADNDTYQFTGDFGRDTVIDNDGSGEININGTLVAELKPLDGTDDIYSSNNIDAVTFSDGTSDNLLLITRPSGGERSNSVLIKNWHEGDLGIQILQPEDGVINNAATGTFHGDTAANVIDTGTSGRRCWAVTWMQPLTLI